jgi:hypothetical protein
MQQLACGAQRRGGPGPNAAFMAPANPLLLIVMLRLILSFAHVHKNQNRNVKR